MQTDEPARLDEFIISLLNFSNIAVNLFSEQGRFERFFEKLYVMDKRALYLFIKKNKAEFSASQLAFAKLYFERGGLAVKWN